MGYLSELLRKSFDVDKEPEDSRLDDVRHEVDVDGSTIGQRCR